MRTWLTTIAVLTLATQSFAEPETRYGQVTAADVFQRVAPAVVVVAGDADTAEFGSGFIVDSKGIVITSMHVIAGAKSITVKLHDGRVFPVIGMADANLKLDICALVIDGANLPTVPLGHPEQLRIGDGVLVIGAPLGLEYSIADGLFSSWRQEAGMNLLQFSAPVSPGNSGGPLLARTGEVIGIVTSQRIEGQNLNFAIPIDALNTLNMAQSPREISPFLRGDARAYADYLTSMRLALAGDTPAAIETVKRAIVSAPSFAQAQAYHCQLLLATGAFGEAIMQCKQAAALDSSQASTYSALCGAYVGANRLSDAESACQQALKLDSNLGSAYGNLASVRYAQHQTDQAITLMQRGLALDPQNIAGYTNLANIYINQALETEIRSRTEGRGPGAEREYTHGKLQQAVDVLRRGIALSPRDPEAHRTLALAYDLLGMNQESEAELTTVLQLDPDGPRTQELLKVLRQ